MAQKQNITLAEAKENPSTMVFSRWLVDEWALKWDKLIDELNHVKLNDSPDRMVWSFGAKKRFSVIPMYNFLTSRERGPYTQKIGKSKIPEKIKIFLCLLSNNVVLTKDNMLKRKWLGIPNVTSVTLMNRLNISFSTAVWQVLFGPPLLLV